MMVLDFTRLCVSLMLHWHAFQCHRSLMLLNWLLHERRGCPSWPWCSSCVLACKDFSCFCSCFGFLWLMSDSRLCCLALALHLLTFERRKRDMYLWRAFRGCGRPRIDDSMPSGVALASISSTMRSHAVWCSRWRCCCSCLHISLRNALLWWLAG